MRSPAALFLLALVATLGTLAPALFRAANARGGMV